MRSRLMRWVVRGAIVWVAGRLARKLTERPAESPSTRKAESG